MSVTRSRLHKKRRTGGLLHIHRKNRKFELGRASANTKLVTGKRRVHPVRVRGGSIKWRALRLSEGNYSWGTEQCTRKARILDVVYNSTSNEMVSNKTLVKGAIVQIDGSPFRGWYERHYGVFLGKAKKKLDAKKGKEGEDEKKSKSSKAEPTKVDPSKITKDRKKRWAHRTKRRVIEKPLEHQFKTGRLLARIASRPGQVGCADGYILEGHELTFYQKKIEKKKKKAK
eukprot:158952_1